MRLPAYAKINLFLDVGEKRADGFHTVRSIMHSVSLCDYIELNTEYEGISVSCDNSSVPRNSENIVYKAAKLYFEKYNIKNGRAHFKIEKHIPIAGGLAGGSTDGATALRLLSNAYNTDVDELYAVAEQLGSDVPFCLNSGTCITNGRGEILKPIKNELSYNFIVCKKGNGISTPVAYKKIDDAYGNRIRETRGNMKMIINYLECGSLAFADGFFNIFESVILPEHKEASEIKQLMIENGAVNSLMSGSGPSVFGIFDNNDAVLECADALREHGYEPLICHSVI